MYLNLPPFKEDPELLKQYIINRWEIETGIKPENIDFELAKNYLKMKEVMAYLPFKQIQLQISLP